MALLVRKCHLLRYHLPSQTHNIISCSIWTSCWHTSFIQVTWIWLSHLMGLAIISRMKNISKIETVFPLLIKYLLIWFSLLKIMIQVHPSCCHLNFNFFRFFRSECNFLLHALSKAYWIARTVKSVLNWIWNRHNVPHSPVIAYNTFWPLDSW